MRVFDVVVMGADLRTELAGERLALEYQHELATRVYPGKFVHVRERNVPDDYPVQAQISVELEDEKKRPLRNVRKRNGSRKTGVSPTVV